MANCKVVTGINNVCGDLLQASGVDKDFWVGYVSDLSVKFPLTQTSTISNIQFVPYNGLIKFEGQKFSHKFDYAVTKGAGGGIAYEHKAQVRVMNLSTQDDVEVQRLTQAQDMFIIMQDNNEGFFIYAPSKGFSVVAGDLHSTGQQAGEDVLTTINFSSNEKVLPLRFAVGTTTQNTVDYLNSLIR